MGSPCFVLAAGRVIVIVCVIQPEQRHAHERPRHGELCEVQEGWLGVGRGRFAHIRTRSPSRWRFVAGALLLRGGPSALAGRRRPRGPITCYW